MKKLLVMMTCMMMGVAMSACSAVGTASGNEIDAIIEKGEIVLATSPDYPPFEFILPDGSIAGFDIAIAEAIANELGVDLRIESIDFDGLLPALATQKVDFILAGLSSNPTREQAFGLSASYYETGFAFLVKTGNEALYPDIESVQGVNVVVQKGSVQETFASEHGISQMTSLPKMNDMLQYLETGRAEVVIVDAIVAQTYVATGKYTIAFETLDEEAGGNVVAVHKEHTQLLNRINEIIANLQADGSLEQFMLEALELQSQQY